VKPAIYNYIIGLGGRDVRVIDFVNMVENVARNEIKAGAYEFWGVRE